MAIRRVTRAQLRALVPACVLLAAAVLPGAVHAAPSAPLEAFGRLPGLSNVTVSGDGTKLALVQTVNGQRLLVVHSLVDRKPVGSFQLGDVKLRSVRWIDSSRLLVITSVTDRMVDVTARDVEWFLGQICEAGKGCRNLRLRVPDEPTIEAIAGGVDVRVVDGKPALFVVAYRLKSSALPTLFRVDPETGSATVVEKGGEFQRDWLLDEAGRIAAAFEYDEKSKRWTLKVRRNGALQPVLNGVAPIETPGLVCFSPDGSAVLFSTYEGGDPQLTAVPLVAGTAPPPLPAEAARARLLTDSLTGRLLGYVRDHEDVVLFDEDHQRRWDSINAAFPGARLRLVDADSAFQRILVREFGRGPAPRIHAIDWTTKRADPIGNEYPDVPVAGVVKRISYTAADGMTIPAILTLPPGREPKNLPLIALPHGGPAAADEDDFDWWAQALASRGYAVLQPNFRGSSLNWAHLSAGFGEWGRKMQTDVSDGVAKLAKDGTIDPKRVCIAGASYGGYAALAGVTLQNGIYRCSASIAGVSDLRAMLAWVADGSGRGDSRVMRYWLRFMGGKNRNDPALDETSPARRADAVNVPLLLIHGRDDTVVPFEQSEIMVAAMKKLQKPVEFVPLAKEDHWLSRSESRLQMLKVLVEFLERNNPP